MQFDFRNIDIEDFADIIVSVEQSFLIKLNEDDLFPNMSFSDFCSVVIQKIDADESSDCTGQQAFYKLRETILKISTLKKESISPETKLLQVFPKKSRRIKIKELENELGFKLHLLSIPNWLKTIFFCILLISIALFFVNWKIALVSFISSTAIWNISEYFGTTLTAGSIKDVVKNIVSFHYRKSRRNPFTFNRHEIENAIKEICVTHCSIFEHEITAKTIFY